MLKEYTKRISICVLGLAIFSLGNLFGVKAGGAGTNAWNTLALGISETTCVSFGTGNLLVSVVIVAIDLIFKGNTPFIFLGNFLGNFLGSFLGNCP